VIEKRNSAQTQLADQGKLSENSAYWEKALPLPEADTGLLRPAFPSKRISVVSVNLGVISDEPEKKLKQRGSKEAISEELTSIQILNNFIMNDGQSPLTPSTPEISSNQGLHQVSIQVSNPEIKKPENSTQPSNSFAFQSNSTPESPVISKTPSEEKSYSDPDSGVDANAAQQPKKPKLRNFFLAQAVWDSEPQEEGELEFARGDIIKIVNSEDDEWWLGELKEAEGWVPAAYLRRIDEKSFEVLPNCEKIVEAMWDYSSYRSEELNFKRGDLIKVLWDDDPYWCQGENLRNHNTGWFPANLVALLDEDDD